MSNTISINKKSVKNNPATKAATIDESIPPMAQKGENKDIPLDQIDLSPLNHRRYFSEQALTQFAAELARHGFLHPVTVRTMPSGRYELVIGERRIRAARIAKLPIVPAIVKELTDDEVREIQLSENLQREDPHPMDEAYGIAQMQQAGKTIDEIAARLSKSKQFVYGRIKLLNLIEAFQEMFLADVISTQEALEIAALSAESQQDFFSENCEGWDKKKNVRLHNLYYLLSRYKYDLKNAPFNTKDKNLLAGVGACTVCPSNTATLKSLFPETAKHAVCTNKQCYQQKCTAHFSIAFMSAFIQYKPAAILFCGSPSALVEKVIQSQPEAAALPKYDYNDISVLHEPEEPLKENYMFEPDEETGSEELDGEGFDDAMLEYLSDKDEYQSLLDSGKYLKGLVVSERSIEQVLFSTEMPKRNSSGSGVTAKQVQEAIKTGTATPDLLKAEITRIKTKEIRSQEIDRGTVHLSIHSHFAEQIKEVSGNKLTAEDRKAVRLLVYQTLSYSDRQQVEQALFSRSKQKKGETLYDRLNNLTDRQFSYMIRVAVTGKSDSKYPNNNTGFYLRKMAESAGVDTAAIEQEQNTKVQKRQAAQKERIKDLEMRLKKMKPVETA